MKLIEKIPGAQRAIEFISRHDDAPIEAVEAALAKVAAHIAAELEAARERRAAAAEAAAAAEREKQTISAADVATLTAADLAAGDATH